MKIILENYILKDSPGYLRVNAYSVNGIIYVAHYFEEIYLVNIMKFGKFPEFI